LGDETGTVWFVGAGPGDPDLITVKGRDLITKAGAILVAGSLVAEAATEWAPDGCLIADSKAMTLDKIVSWLVGAAERNETVVRLQTGDPTLYGALVEMTRPLVAAGIMVRSVPGVSSAMASACAAMESLTLPEITQTVILTRMAGRTPMPEGESLSELAAHRTTLCIYLSATLGGYIREELLKAGWREKSPALVVHKATWPGEERVFRTTIEKLPQTVSEEKIKGQAMIIVSPTLGACEWPELPASKLYAPSFSHRFRQAGDN